MALAQPAREQSFIMVSVGHDLNMPRPQFRVLNGCNGIRTSLLLMQIKPDGVQRGKVAEIIRRFEQLGVKLVGIKASGAAGKDLPSSALCACYTARRA